MLEKQFALIILLIVSHLTFNNVLIKKKTPKNLHLSFNYLYYALLCVFYNFHCNISLLCYTFHVSVNIVILI